MTSRRAVAPVIATLLLVAIAVVGGSIIFVFSQGFFSSAQVSGTPQIESLELTGYDMTDGAVLVTHDGFCTNGGEIDGATGEVCDTATEFDGGIGDGLVTGDRFTLYVQNQSVGSVTITEVLLAGAPYVYLVAPPTGGALLAYNAVAAGTPDAGEFVILTNGDIDNTVLATKKVVPSGTLSPGEDVTLLFAIDDDVPIGRDVQLKLTTSNGNVFVIYSPTIQTIEVVKRGRVRRAKLYYLRERKGKAARIKERRR